MQFILDFGASKIYMKEFEVYFNTLQILLIFQYWQLIVVRQ